MGLLKERGNKESVTLKAEMAEINNLSDFSLSLFLIHYSLFLFLQR